MTDDSLSLAVLNHGGRDPFIDYADGPGGFEPGVHPPVNFHAYAAATNGAFFDSVNKVLAGERFHTCLVLMRKKLLPALDAVTALKAAGRKVFVSWKECGQAQITGQLIDARNLEIYRKILAACDGVISPTLVAPPCVESQPVHRIPTPYPVELPEWDYAIPLDQREGIFIGTREFFTPTRNHLAAVTAALRVARDNGTFVSVVNTDKGKGRKLLNALDDGNLRVIDGPLNYREYLKRLAGHRVVFQLDRSAVPGQVAGDALLARVPCVGGNSAIEQLAFPADSHPALSETDAESRLAKLLRDETLLQSAIVSAQELAMENVSYTAVARQLSMGLA